MATESKSDTASVAQAIDKANKGQSSQALIIQSYANSVNQQPMVDFSGEEKLKKYETDINSGLKTAQSHASNYLNVIQPSIIENISNIENYYALHNAVATVLPEGSTEKQWLDALNALATQSGKYRTAALGVVTQLQTLSKNLNTDSASFTTTVTNLNAAVEGDNGILESITSQLDTIQGQIDGAIAGVALSGLAIAGGVFVICVGAITDFVTAGASTPVVVGGVALLAGGIGGEVASAVTLKNLNDEKASLLTEQANLKAEVKLATGISTGYKSLNTQVTGAVTAATSMSNAWTSLSADLKSMIDDLQNGVKNTGEIRKIFLTAANTVIKTVLADIGTIKKQMSGVSNVVAKKGQTVGEAAVAAAEGKGEVLEAVPIKFFKSGAPSASGTLSQSLDNLIATDSRIRAISNLPAGAVTIQNETVANTSSITSQIRSLQGHVGSYVNSALPQLNTIETMLTNKEPFDKIKAAVKSLQKETGSLSTNSNQVLSSIQNTMTITNSYFNQLNLIQASLTAQRTNLEAQLLNAQSREEAAKKKYYWLIALGPFGLIGLAAALAAYLAIKSEVDGYKDQVNSLNSQISSLNSISAATDDLSTNIGDVVSKASSVNNAVSFVANDVLNIENDLGSGDDPTIVKLLVATSITEVNTLKVDAS